MRQQWLRSLALSLGVWVIGQCAFFAAETPAPVIEPYPPVETPSPKAAPKTESEAALAVSLDCPVPLRDERPLVDQKIQPTGLFANRGEDAFALSPSGSFPIGQPMPVGPAAGNTPLPMPAPVLNAAPPADVPYSWRQPPVSSPMPQGTSSTPLVPIPSTQSGTDFGMDSGLPGGTIVSPPGGIATPGTIPTPGVVTGPTGAPLVDDGCGGKDCCTPGCCDGVCCEGVCGEGCGGCWAGCCGLNNGCCFGNRWYGSAEYLLWFIKGQMLPPLLTSGSVADAVPGALGQPGTNVLFGGTGYQNNPYSGLRLRGGYWFNDCHGLGLDLGGFFLGGNKNTFTSSSFGVPLLARPFFNALTGAQDAEYVATPPNVLGLGSVGLAGTFTAVNTFFLYGAEANLRRNLCCGCNWFIDGFAGWRLLGLNESLSMTENLAIYSSANPALPSGTTFLVHDRFGTSNLFNGGQIGVIGEYRFGRWSINVREGIALGGTQQFVNVSGATTTSAPGILPTTSPGGLLALPSNIGPHTHSMVSFVEEVGVNLGYQFTNHIRGFVGYNFLFWSSVVRPGEQIDTTVNPNLIPPTIAGGPNRPAFSINGSNFWVQGLTLGIDIRW
jgi:hypothetical protein